MNRAGLGDTGPACYMSERSDSDGSETNKHKAIMEQIQEKDILAGTWGATMTIPEFFEVTGKAAKTLKVRRLAKEMLKPNACGQQGYEVPAKPLRNDEREFEGTARLAKSGGLYVKMEYGTIIFVEKWDGSPVFANYMD